MAVWREGEGAGDIPGHDRRNLPRASTLVIWTAPPGPAELRAALAQVRPGEGLPLRPRPRRRHAGSVHPPADRPGQACAERPRRPCADRWRSPRPQRSARPPCGSASPGWPPAGTSASSRRRAERYSSRPAMASALAEADFRGAGRPSAGRPGRDCGLPRLLPGGGRRGAGAAVTGWLIPPSPARSASLPAGSCRNPGRRSAARCPT